MTSIKKLPMMSITYPTSWLVISADPSFEYTTIFQHFIAIICPKMAGPFTVMKAPSTSTYQFYPTTEPQIIALLLMI
jgi:hypothetical protein